MPCAAISPSSLAPSSRRRATCFHRPSLRPLRYHFLSRLSGRARTLRSDVCVPLTPAVRASVPTLAPAAIPFIPCAAISRSSGHACSLRPNVGVALARLLLSVVPLFQRHQISSRILPPRYRRQAALCSSHCIAMSAPPRALHSCCCCRYSLSLTRRRFLYVFTVCRCWYNRNNSSWSPKSMPVCCNTSL